jgi:hypothetical protein
MAASTASHDTAVVDAPPDLLGDDAGDRHRILGSPSHDERVGQPAGSALVPRRYAEFGEWRTAPTPAV